MKKLNCLGMSIFVCVQLAAMPMYADEEVISEVNVCNSELGEIGSGILVSADGYEVEFYCGENGSLRAVATDSLTGNVHADLPVIFQEGWTLQKAEKVPSIQGRNRLIHVIVEENSDRAVVYVGQYGLRGGGNGGQVKGGVVIQSDPQGETRGGGQVSIEF